jgi:hypothetical protein
MPSRGFTLKFSRGPRSVTGFTLVLDTLQLQFDRLP